MSARDDLDLVVRLACLTEDRSAEEQRAMIATALRLDCDFGAFTAHNLEHGARPPELLRNVLETYCPDPVNGPVVSGPVRAQLERYGRLVTAWSACGDCGKPIGVHGPKPELRCP